MHCWDRTWRRVFCDKSVITLIPFHRNRDRSRQFYIKEPFRALISNSMSVSKTKSAMARCASWPSLYPLESSRPWQAHIQRIFRNHLSLAFCVLSRTSLTACFRRNISGILEIGRVTMYNFERGGMKMKKLAIVNKKRCAACGACMKVCPRAAIHIEQGCFAMVNAEKCVGCGLCAKTCPADCVEIRERSDGHA